MDLEIIYQDKYLVAINKPHGLLVHKSNIASDVEVFAVQKLRDQLGAHVHPCHRIDRKTSGALLFARTKEAAKGMQKLFASNSISKIYWAIVRGYTQSQGVINYALVNDKGKKQEAITHFKTLKQSEIPVPMGKFPTSRYSLIEAKPKTGRMHQIRKHFAHISHPIIGDRPHGCNKQNRLFKQKWGIDTMMLHAKELEFEHPISGKNIFITAHHQTTFEHTLKIVDLI